MSAPNRKAYEALVERAHRLARPAEQTQTTEDRTEIVTFMAAGGRYAVDTRFVHAILPFEKPSAIPGAPSVFTGLINFRGEILPVIDLPRFLDLKTSGAESAWMVALGDRSAEIAIAVGSGVEIDFIRDSDVITPPDRGDETCVRGVTRDALTILDGAALLASRRLFIDRAP